MIIKTSYPFMKPPPSARLIRGHRLAQGLVGCWLFNEAGGLQVFDLSENGSTGIFGAGAASPTWVPGKFGSALNFDGGDYVSLTGFTSSSTTHTISMWVYGTGTQSAEYLLDIQTGRILIGWGSDTAGQIGIYDGAWRLFGNTPSNNNWHHLVFVLDGTTSKMRMYLNGIQYGSELSYTPHEIGGAVILGARYSASQFFFVGQLDLPMIYNRVLSPSEVAELTYNPFCMLERRARTALMSGYEVVAPPVGMAGAMTTNTGYWGW